MLIFSVATMLDWLELFTAKLVVNIVPWDFTFLISFLYFVSLIFLRGSAFSLSFFLFFCISLSLLILFPCISSSQVRWTSHTETGKRLQSRCKGTLSLILLRLKCWEMLNLADNHRENRVEVWNQGLPIQGARLNMWTPLSHSRSKLYFLQKRKTSLQQKESEIIFITNEDSCKNISSENWYACISLITIDIDSQVSSVQLTRKCWGTSD
jgi:hypothetical protein